MGVLLAEASGWGTNNVLQSALALFNPLASPNKFSSSQYNFRRILLDHNFWINLGKED